MSTPFLSDDLDPRLTPARDDLAASWLKERVKASRYADPVRHTVTQTIANIYLNPEDGLPLESQLLYGEQIDVYESKDGWAWMQSVRDGYVGYARSETITIVDEAKPATHRISNIASHLYPAAQGTQSFKTGATLMSGTGYKTTPALNLSYGSHVHVATQNEVLSVLDSGHMIPTAHLAPIDFHSEDHLAEAFRFLGVPYVWGGRSHQGVDCSSLVQLVLQACNIKAPRDCDLQERLLGKPIDRTSVRGGDLAFFRGHVGIMVDENTILHANDRAMAVSIDDLDEFLRWRTVHGASPLKMFKRF